MCCLAHNLASIVFPGAEKKLVRHSAIAHANVERKKRQARIEFHNTETALKPNSLCRIPKWQIHAFAAKSRFCCCCRLCVLCTQARRDVCNLRFGITWRSQRPQSRQTTESPLYGAKQIHWGESTITQTDRPYWGNERVWSAHITHFAIKNCLNGCALHHY